MIWTRNKIDRALAEAERWVGTPHKLRMCIHPDGIDCGHYLREILVAGCVLERRPMAINFTEEAESKCSLTKFITDHLFARELAKGEPSMDGDIPIIGTCGFVARGVLWQAQLGLGVVRLSWAMWERKATTILRLIEPGWKTDPARRFR